MANKGYCTFSAVEQYLGLTFTTNQQGYADDLIGFAESYIDRATRRAWIVPPITGEIYRMVEPQVYLRSSPVTSIQTITWRSPQPSDVAITLNAGSDYELLDPKTGWVTFGASYKGRDALAFISYTPNLPVPADISRAAAMIAGQSMVSNLYPDRLGIAQAQTEQRAAVQYTENGTTLQIPADAQRILDHYVLPVIA